MPILVPRAVAQFNKRYNNPFQRKFAWLIPPYALVEHTGRKSGKSFYAPVVGLVGRRGGGSEAGVSGKGGGKRLIVLLAYGKDSDWVRNLVAAGGGGMRRIGRSYSLSNPMVVGSHSPEAAGLALRHRIAARLVADILIVDFE